MIGFEMLDDRRFSVALRRSNSSPIEEKLRGMRKKLCRQINKLFAFVFYEDGIGSDAVNQIKIRKLTTFNVLKEWLALFEFAIQMIEAQVDREKELELTGQKRVRFDKD